MILFSKFKHVFNKLNVPISKFILIFIDFRCEFFQKHKVLKFPDY